MEDYEQAGWVIIFANAEGRWISDGTDSEQLDDSESDLTEDQVYYDDKLGYIHADGSPIRIKE